MILDIQNVSCRYTSREKDTLTGVNLRIEEGEMVLIAGRSGCGKSTLVKAVTGLLDKEDGSIDGKIFFHVRQKYCHINNPIPTATAGFQHRFYIGKNRMTFCFNIVFNNITISI